MKIRIKKKKEKQYKFKNMEIGNLLFGNSRGIFKFPNIKLVNSEEWIKLCEKAQVDNIYGSPEIKRDFNGFDNETFTIRPYYWGDDSKEAELSNFYYKPSGFSIDWYKYAFRDSYMNRNLSEQQILKIFKKCAESIQD